MNKRLYNSIVRGISESLQKSLYEDLFDDVDEPSKSAQDDAPMLPQEPEEENKKDDDVLSYDVQKELEAKFDELFGALEDDDN